MPLFGSANVGAVTLVETPVSQWYVRRARIAFLTVWVASGLLVAVMSAAFVSLWWAVPLGVLAGGVLGVVAGALVRTWPVVRVLWWWSIEITAVLVPAVGLTVVSRLTVWWVALLLALAVAAFCLAVPRVRRWLSAVSWCLVVRHRIRLCFSRLIRPTGAGRQGLLPLVLWVRPTPAGERVWLWLRPGLELADLDGRTGQMAVTCFADQVRASRASQRFAAMVRVDVSRRDPLAGVVPSPLALLIPNLRRPGADVPMSPGVPRVGLDLADIPEPAPEPAPRGRR